MNPYILQFLADMATAILTIAGVAYLPLIVLIVFRAGGLRGLNEENASERLLDLCCDTLKEQIKNKIEELLQVYYNNSVPLPSGRRIQDAAAFLHQDSESLEQLLMILKNMTELGVQSQEFLQVLLYLSQ
uniref:Uncharacterized protein n=3 Tax=Beta vulgaris TaxID=161934 RepID=A0A173M918_BETVV|nr:hypothetical protein [Beta vulgaris]BAV04020.1 hypothetical protein [Beta vulgaris subsp. vulgaris]